MATFYVANFGCRAAQADGAALERQLRERGLERADEPAKAGLVVLNTCTVTAAADQDARAAIRRIHRKNPKAQIVVTGCYAQRAPEEIAALPGVSQVIGNSDKHQLAQLIGPQTSDLGPRPSQFVPLTQLSLDVRSPRSEVRAPIFVSDIFAHAELQAAPVFDAANERTRPNLKVQDGCDNRCSFCVIPYVRGQSRSLELAEVIREVDALVSAGYREVVISGINLGRWGRDLDVSPEPSALGNSGQRPTVNGQRPEFEDLVRAILSETGLQKLRISSVEPMDWSDELIHLMAASSRVAKHAHVPLQSGSDAVLRRMHRKYRPWHYREKVEKIRAAMPTAAIGADVMAGFPGETEAEFDETCRFIEDLPLTYLHVFTYSARPGTPAAAMDNQVPVHIARERNRILRDLASKKKLAFMNGLVGQQIKTITLNVSGRDPAGEYTEGLTDNYLPIRVPGKHAANRWIQTRVERVSDGALLGIAS
ncbi:MAG: MiaB/RimO family radical SAM methylthiotransferase [Acidobacteriia bacterium]|nr:MiaB/RimO family radical SAM methylthiotransferase [Terriglobia bacterium]